MITSLILEGDAQEAIRQINSVFPNIIKEKPIIGDYLFCFNFIELIKNKKEEEAIDFGRNFLVNNQTNQINVIKNEEIVQIEINVT